jgi:hypothetical protein
MRGVGTLAARRWFVASALSTGLLLAACGDSDERSVCDAYADYVVTADALLAADITAATVDQAEEALEDLRDEVEQVQAVADTLNEAQVLDMQQRLDDVVRSLGAFDDDVAFSDVAELISDDIEAARDADLELRRVFDPICIPGS